MIKILKIDDLIYENIEVRTPIFDEQGNKTSEQYIDPRLKDITFFKQCLKDTLDWFTTQYVNKKLQKIQEDLQDIATEQSWLEGVFYSIGLDPNQVKAEITKVVLGQEDIDTAITNLNIPSDFVEDFKRAVEIAKIIAWKERIWKEEEKLESQIDSYTSVDDLLNIDIKKMCENAYSKITM